MRTHVTERSPQVSRTIQSKEKASRQASPEAILQRYAARTLQAAGMDDDELLQGKFAAVQRAAFDEEEPLQGKFTTAQREAMDDDDLLQGKFSATVQRVTGDEDELLQGKFGPVQRQLASAQMQDEPESAQRKGRENRTGLPDDLKAGVENLSGFSMDSVRVHYNSPKPAQLQALAYTQGTDIHVGPGQERHLPHEAWHVVQQMQGRVQPTMQMQGVNINDNVGLEAEADVQGDKSFQRIEGGLGNIQLRTTNSNVVQCGRDEEIMKIARNIWAGRVDLTGGKNRNSLGDEQSDYLMAVKIYDRKHKQIIDKAFEIHSGDMDADYFAALNELNAEEDEIRQINNEQAMDDEERIKERAYFKSTGDQDADYYNAKEEEERRRLKAVEFAKNLAAKLGKNEIQKVIPEPDFKYHLKMKLEDNGKGSKGVSGFVTAAESLTSRNYDEVFEGLRLDYSGTKFDKSKPFGVIKTKIEFEDDKLILATKENLKDEGISPGAKPFTGTGMTGSSKMIIPEFKLKNFINMENGTLEICNRQGLYETCEQNKFVLRGNAWNGI